MMTASTTTDGATAEVSTGVHLAYRVVGTGEPVLLIVGTAGTLGLWAPLEPALAQQRRVISFDNRGLGGSGRGTGPLTTATMADDAAALLDMLEIERSHVLGWSLGSGIAQELALRHPERVASLVLDGTWARLDGFQTAVLGALRHPWDTGHLSAGLGAMGLCFSPQTLNAPEFPQLLEQFLPLFPLIQQGWATPGPPRRQEKPMAIELLNPDGLPKPEPYRQVAVATGSRTVFLAGQVARTATGEPVGAGDLAAQVEHAYINVATALAAVGGSFDDIAKLTLYIVDWSEAKMPALGEGVARAAARLGIDPVKPITLIPVAALGEPDLLVEVDATAVL